MSKNISYNTRFEQLKKLYRMSYKYADKIGYISFLKAATSTFRHEVFSVFAPDPKRIQIFDVLIMSDNFMFLNSEESIKS